MLQATRVWAVLLLMLCVTFLQVQGQGINPIDFPNCTNGDIRLSDGNTEMEGRVEICLENRWGTVCDDGWDNLDAAVVCRQLGFSADGARFTRDALPFGPGEGPIFVESVGCLGTEETLLNCTHDGVRNHDCIHFEDAGVSCEAIGFSCEDGDIRLVGGQSQYDGRVEVCRGNRFGVVCDDQTWNDAEAQVACRQLGFEPEGAIPIGGGEYGYGIGGLHFAGLRCTGEEESFFNCTIRFSFRSFLCSHFDDVGLLCPRPNVTCENGDVRLVNGRTPSEGRVEVCYNGHWGTVCHNGWEEEEAGVVCAELGYERDGAIPIGFADFGRGEGLILLSGLGCNGSESNLAECPHAGIAEHFCGHFQDAGVICPDPNINCADGGVRLSKGETPNEGLLEVCYNNNFGTVCSDGFDPVDASVVCNQLGYDPSNSIPLPDAYFGEGVGIILLDSVECVGNESHLLDCAHLGFGVTDCFHSFDVSLLCGTTNASCTNGEIRLVNGTGNHSGRVEICFSDRWGTICDDGWGAHDAEVVCRQLGFPTEGAIGLRAAAFGEGTGPIFLANVNCAPENDSTLIECFVPEEDVGVHTCSHAEDAGVVCPLPTHACLNGEIRLVSGETDLEGRVELCIDGRWGTICDTFWSNLDAAVVCRQLGHGPTDAVAVRGAVFGEGEGPIYLDNFFCSGPEEHILDCLHNRASYDNCRHSEDAGVICKRKLCEDNELRLVGGELESEGRVEICQDRQFGTICDDTFDTLDAMVVCRQLGFSGEGAIPLPRAYFGAGTRRVLIDQLDCIGNETSIEECSQMANTRLCFHNEDASVLCQVEGANCTNGELQLVHGFHECEGTVQVCFNGRWGSICDDQWDHADARTVCRLVGCESEGALATIEAYFDTSDGPIFLDQVQCTGTESNILECPSDEPGLHNCIHIEDSGVICQVRDPSFTCEHGAIRLVDGGRSYQGRVEICINGNWGTVCDDNWDDDDASVVCNQLGFGYAGAAAVLNAGYGEGEGDIYITRSRCNGTEDRLIDCPGIGPDDFCVHDFDAGVNCRVPLCEEGDVRLTGGESENEGTVELCVNLRWAGSICDDDWDNADAAVVCRQLGYEGEDAVAVRGSFFGEGPGEIQRTLVGCFGNESDLSDCSFETPDNSCAHNDDVGVICPTEEANCTTGDVRLAGGRSEYEGRVEVCLHGRWGTVCDDGWDFNDATVVCNQLGFTDNGFPTALHLSAYGFGTGLIFLDEVQCEGTEETLLGCRTREIGLHNCFHSEDASVICPSPDSACPNGAIRLRRDEGNSTYQGTVEVCLSGIWGSVCADRFWGDTDAGVVCSQLGHSTEGAIAVGNAAFGQGADPIQLRRIHCSGSEAALVYCPTVEPFSFFDFVSCRTHRTDAGIICRDPNFSCTEGELRLRDGATEFEGRVEICSDNLFGTICSSGWDGNNAAVVCGQLGYPTENAIPVSNGYFGTGDGLVHFGSVQCNGTEERLMECEREPNTRCTHILDAGVICQVPNPQCTHGDVRLVDGSTELQGRVEVCVGGRWGTVCDDFWDNTDANVVCGQLGFSRQNSLATGIAFFGRGDGPIFIDQTGCFGNESRLLDCPHSGAGVHDCFHSEDAGAICTEIILCEEGDVRLTGGESKNEGTVELCVNNEWAGSICDTEWDNADAAVVCRQLGYEGEVAVAVRGSFFGEGPGEVQRTQVGCFGNESDLSKCSFQPANSFCTHDDDVGVICPTEEANCTAGDVRLVGGPTEYEGRVEVCLHGRWGTVCDDAWDNNDARVVCNQLGFTENGSPVHLHLSAYGLGTGLIFLDEVQCEGTEETLLGCRAREIGLHDCFHSEDASVICPSPDSACPNGAIRLRRDEGNSTYQGTVEVCLSGTWGSVCGNQFWEDANARVVCSQLGHSPEGAIAVGDAAFGQGEGPIQLQRPRCSGNETVLVQCPSDPSGFFFDFTSCRTHSSDAGVICRDPSFSCTDGELRLRDGATEFEGRVEICSDNLFGTICSVGWDGNNAAVVCGQLGYPTENAIPVSNGYFGTGDGLVHFGSVQCNGTEERLVECEREPNTRCIHILDAGVICQVPNPQCTHGDVRLVDGSTELLGRVEVCVGGRWGTVCDDFWDNTDANVVCGQLGFSRQNSVATGIAFFGGGDGPIFIDQTGCFGNESRLLDCPHSGAGVHDCFHFEDAGAICTEIILCEEGDVRLTGGVSKNEGTVELCVNNEWAGSICDTEWDNADAAVVCRQLGYEGEVAVAVRGSFFGEGPGEIQRTQVGCFGHESDLSKCSFQPANSFCTHDDDVGVICPTEEANCTAGDVRLVGGPTEYEGRVEVCLHGRWGTVCDDAWDNNDARVVCNQLGFTENGSPIHLHLSAYGLGTGLIFLDEVQCEGTEETLLGCRAREIGLHNCFHSEDASVICPSPDSACPNGAIRLRRDEGNSTYQGTVEVCLSGTWGSVCGNQFWEDADARVVCSQLGHSPEGAIAVGDAAFGQGEGPIQLQRPRCSGNETVLVQCPSDPSGFFFDFTSCRTHSSDAGVICRDPSFSCTDGELRLRDGATEFEGRVEICSNNHFGTVCSFDWDEADAVVACRQLGYSTTNAVAVRGGYFGTGIGRIHIASVKCARSEQRLIDCARDGIIGGRCTHSRDAGVICQVPNPECTHGDVRLVGGLTELQGRVEVCVGGRWGSVCDDFWDNTDANVVCGQLGFSPNDSIATDTAFFGRSTGPIFIDETGCFGNESRLLDCPHAGAGVHDCQHTEDAGIICKAKTCTEGAMRLVNGVDDYSGRVELCVGGLWGTVCDEKFKTEDANSVCQQQGFKTTGAILTRNAYFGEGEGMIYNSDGTAASDQCSHKSDAGVFCQPSTADSAVQCETGAVRLTGGKTDSEGRVEVCLNGQWGTVCDDSWDDNSAAVVCNQLNLPNGMTTAVLKAGFGEGTGPVFIDDIKCRGNETNILSCPQLPVNSNHDCSHTEDAGIRCQQAATTDTRATKKSTNTAAIVVPIVLIVIIIVVVMIVGIIVILYRRKRSGKFFVRQADEIPITRTESFSSTAAASEAPEKPDLQQYETSSESPL